MADDGVGIPGSTTLNFKLDAFAIKSENLRECLNSSFIRGEIVLVE
jgi:hypothetical protein